MFQTAENGHLYCQKRTRNENNSDNENATETEKKTEKYYFFAIEKPK